MTDSDSGVETGSEGNESVSMSVESPERSDEEQGSAEVAAAVAPPLVDPPPKPGPSYEHTPYLAQHNYVSKIRPAALLRHKHNARWRVYPLVLGYIGEKKLRQAAAANDIDTVQKLLEAGVDPCTADEKKRTALHYAVCRGNPILARLLLEKGADPNQRDILGNTPLHLAACTSHIELITLLLRAGTDVTAVDHSGRSPLQLALSKLRLLRAEMARTSAHVKSEVIQVVKMMQVYLERQGKNSEVSQLSAFKTRFLSRSTKEEVENDVAGLLASLSHLTLCR